MDLSLLGDSTEWIPPLIFRFNGRTKKSAPGQSHNCFTAKYKSINTARPEVRGQSQRVLRTEYGDGVVETERLRVLYSLVRNKQVLSVNTTIMHATIQAYLPSRYAPPPSPT